MVKQRYEKAVSKTWLIRNRVNCGTEVRRSGSECPRNKERGPGVKEEMPHVCWVLNIARLSGKLLITAKALATKWKL